MSYSLERLPCRATGAVEIAFFIRAASRAQAIEKARHRFADLCAAAGIEAANAPLTLLALEPHLEEAADQEPSPG